MTVIPPRFPLNIYDELLFHFDEPSSPLVQQMEVRLAPQLNPELLQAAILSAAQAHPIMQASMAPYSANDSQFFWQYAEPLQEAPLQVKTATNDDEVAALRDDFYSGAISLIEAPPFRCLLVQVDNDESILMLKASSVASDSVGLKLFLHTILNAYNTPHAPELNHNFLAIRNQHQQLREKSDGFKAIAKLLEALSATLKPASRIAATGPEGATGLGIAPIVFSAAQTKALQLETATGANLSSQVLTALHLAVEKWNQGHQQKTGAISFLHPMNIRQEPWQDSIASNLSMWVNINSLAKDRQDAAELKALMEKQTEQLLDAGVLHLLVDLAQEMRRLPAWMRQIVPGLLPLTGGRLAGTGVVGTLDPLPKLHTDHVTAKEWFFSPPCKMPAGVSLGAMVYDHRLHLALRYHQQQFTQEDAWAFAETFLDALHHSA